MRKLLRVLPDKQYIQLQYFYHFKRLPNLKNPKTFNEKLQWLKLRDRDPEYTAMVDKHLVKQYVADKIGQEYIIPTIAVWETPEQIDFDALPNQFVLKWNHDSGSVIICKDKSTFDRQAALEIMRKGRDHNGFWYGREWPYKNVEPCIIAEQYVEDNQGTESLPVYKFFTFGGEVKIIQTIQNDKKPNETIDYFDRDWNLMEFKQNFPNSKTPFKQPAGFAEMLRLAEKLSQGRPFLRVDFYQVKDKVYFSEYTFYSDSGMAPFDPPEWDKTLGDWIKLPE